MVRNCSLSNDTPLPESQEQIIKGYRVNVSYDAISQEEAQRKRNSIAKVITDALKKKKK